jgi:hypothetical protein
MVSRARGEDTPSEPKSSEGEVTLPSLRDIFHRQVVVTVDAHWSKWTWIETGPLIGSPPQPHLMQVSPAYWGSSIMPVLIEPTHLYRISQVLSCLPATRGATAMITGPSSSSLGGMVPPPKKGCHRAFLCVSSWYVCGIVYCLSSPCFSCFLP